MLKISSAYENLQKLQLLNDIRKYFSTWWEVLWRVLPVCQRFVVCSFALKRYGRTSPIFSACCLWPWLGSPLAVLRYAMYFRFCKWLYMFSHNDLFGGSCVLPSGNKIHKHNSRGSNQILLNDKDQQVGLIIVSCAKGAKSAIYDCLVIWWHSRVAFWFSSLFNNNSSRNDNNNGAFKHTLRWDGMGCAGMRCGAENSTCECLQLHWNTLSYQRSPSHTYIILAQHVCDCTITNRARYVRTSRTNVRSPVLMPLQFDITSGLKYGQYKNSNFGGV